MSFPADDASHPERHDEAWSYFERMVISESAFLRMFDLWAVVDGWPARFHVLPGPDLWWDDLDEMVDRWRCRWARLRAAW